VTTVKVNGQDWETGIPAGCSSPNGHYVGKNVVLTALGAGWQDEDAGEAAAEYDELGGDPLWQYSDAWHDIVQDAEDWLNEHTEGGFWHWSDGDFRLDVPVAMEARRSSFESSIVAECPQCGNVCAHWDADDLDDEGRLMCYHEDW